MNFKKMGLNHYSLIIGVVFLLIASYLNLHTFSYNPQTKEMVIASKLWSDFGAHIPLIRSFSLGNNWPPEYPIFPGEKIRYHFLFYALVGTLEKIGFRIDVALNSLSILGFFLLLVMIYKLTILFFEKKRIALLAVFFFLFNGTLSFLEFFKTHPLNLNTVSDILTLNQFPSFGPWGGQLVTAFTNLNVYTNQRHLSFSFALVLLVIYLLLKRDLYLQKLNKLMGIKKNNFLSTSLNCLYTITTGFLVGSLFFLNHPALMIILIFSIYLFIFHAKTRIPLFIILITSLPFLGLFLQIAQPGGAPVWEVGYLSHKPFAWLTFLEFWLHNLGLHIIFIPLGFLFTPKRYRFFFLPLLILFTLPNLFRFSVDMINNHKFFNFVSIIGSMYSALAFFTVWSFVFKKLKKLKNKNNLIARTLILLAGFTGALTFTTLTFSGILDFFVIHNDYNIVLKDLPQNQDALFFVNNTPKEAVVLNSTWMYHPASLAGRKIYNGYSFFTWSAGYDTYGREKITKIIYQSEDVARVCDLLYQARISYIELNKNPEEFLKPISSIWTNATPLYTNPETGVSLFATKALCQKSP